MKPNAPTNTHSYTDNLQSDQHNSPFLSRSLSSSLFDFPMRVLWRLLIIWSNKFKAILRSIHIHILNTHISFSSLYLTLSVLHSLCLSFLLLFICATPARRFPILVTSKNVYIFFRHFATLDSSFVFGVVSSAAWVAFLTPYEGCRDTELRYTLTEREGMHIHLF